MTELISEILHSLGRNRTRTILTGLAVVWGIFMLVVLLGMARGMVNSFEDNMSQQNFEAITIWPGATVYPYKGYQPGRRIKLLESDIGPIERQNHRYVDQVIVDASNSTATLTAPRATVGGGFRGVMPGARSFEQINDIEGRFINRADLDSVRKVMVLSRKNADLLFGTGGSAIGQYVGAMGLAWQVVGVYDHRWRNDVFVPYTTARMLSGNEPRVDQMTVVGRNLHNEADARGLEDGVVATLAALHDFDRREGSTGAVWVWNRFDNYLRGRRVSDVLTGAVWVIGVLTLLTGIVGVSNIMFVSVRERTHEIGIRRAIGARPRAILTSVIAESIMITLIFGYIGIVVGMGATMLADHLLGDSGFLLRPGITLTMALEVMAVLTAAGAAAGMFPALKATRISPVEALRDE